MLKKSLFAGGGLLLLLALFFGRDGLSYLTTFSDQVTTSVKDSVPVKFELDRARNMIAGLDPEIVNHKRAIAREELDLDKLERKVATEDMELAKAWGHIERLRDDLARGNSTFVYSGQTYTAKQVENDLTNRFDRYASKHETLKSHRKILAARRQGLQAAQEKLREMIAAKRKLEEEVVRLCARLEMVEVAKTSSEFNIDDSQLSRTRELLADIEARIEVDAQLVNADDVVADEIPLEEPSEATSILERITKFEANNGQDEEVLITVEQ
jgi:hypothetical protein